MLLYTCVSSDPEVDEEVLDSELLELVSDSDSMIEYLTLFFLLLFCCKRESEEPDLSSTYKRIFLIVFVISSIDKSDLGGSFLEGLVL